MVNAPYLRTHALLCLEMARQMSAPVDAASFRAMAVQYVAQAEALERKEGPHDLARNVF